MRKILVAPDSFKGSLTALEACEAMTTGIRRALPDAEIVEIPMADGGEGTVQSLVDATDGKVIEAEVVGPLGDPVTAKYGLLGNGKTAVIEMAEASGLGYVTEKTKNPMVATTYGTGQLILACLDQGIQEIIIGLGGSATNDGGAGMAQALGYQLIDKAGNVIGYGGGALADLATIKVDQVDKRLKATHFIIASDVNNPLVGPEGASAVFGPQKGADEEMVASLDQNLQAFADIIQEDLGKSIADTPGAGAAGGLGGGFLAFTQAEMNKGIEIVLAYTKLQEAAVGCDLCLTGEGGIDFQTKFGKTPYGVAQAFKSVNPDKKVIALAGHVGKGIDELYTEGIEAVFGIAPGAASLDDLIANAKDNLASTTENIIRAIYS